MLSYNRLRVDFIYINSVGFAWLYIALEGI